MYSSVYLKEFSLDLFEEETSVGIAHLPRWNKPNEEVFSPWLHTEFHWEIDCVQRPGSLQRAWLQGPVPSRGSGRAVELKAPHLVSNVQPRWALTGSKLTSSIHSAAFPREDTHSPLLSCPWCGLLSSRSNPPCEHARALQDWIIGLWLENLPYTVLNRAGNYRHFLEWFSISRSKSK